MKPVETQAVVQSASPLAESCHEKRMIKHCAPNPPNPLCIHKCTIRFYYRARGMKPDETQTVVQSASPLAESLPWKTDDECQRGIKGDSELYLSNQLFIILPEKHSMSAKYNKKLKPLARNLRKFGTKGEALLWRDVLKAKQHWPYQFNRQFIIGNYIVDFICRRLKLIIEIDGSSHIAKSKEDFQRQQYLESLGFTVLRFSESLVIYRIDEVVAEIDYAIQCLEQKIEDEKDMCSQSP